MKPTYILSMVPNLLFRLFYEKLESTILSLTYKNRRMALFLSDQINKRQKTIDNRVTRQFLQDLSGIESNANLPKCPNIVS